MSATAMLVGTPTDAGGRPDAATSRWRARRSRRRSPPTSRSSSILTVDRGAAPRRTCGSAGSAPISRRCSPARTPAGSRSRSTGPSSTGRSSTRTSRGTASARWCSSRSRRRPPRRRWRRPPRPARSWRDGRRRGTSVRWLPFSRATRGPSPIDPEDPEPGDRRRPEPVPGRSVDRRHAGRARNDPVPEPGDRRRPEPVPGRSSTAGTQGEPGTIPYLSQGIGVDQSQFQGEASTAGTVATPAAHDEAGTASSLATPGIHDEATAVAAASARRSPGNDEATLTARGVDPAIATAMTSHGEAATASRPRPSPVSTTRRRPRRAASARPSPAPTRRPSRPAGSRRRRCTTRDARHPRHRVRAGRRRLRLEPRAAVRRLGHGRRDRRPRRREPADRRRRVRGPAAHDARLAPSSAEGRCVAAALRALAPSSRTPIPAVTGGDRSGAAWTRRHREERSMTRVITIVAVLVVAAIAAASARRQWPAASADRRFTSDGALETDRRRTPSDLTGTGCAATRSTRSTSSAEPSPVVAPPHQAPGIQRAAGASGARLPRRAMRRAVASAVHERERRHRQ